MRSAIFLAGILVTASAGAIVRLSSPAESAYVSLGTNYLFVGRFNGNSGVLIGDNMVLTAGHLFPGPTATVPFVLNGTTYQVTNCARDPLYNGSNIINGHDFTIGRITTRVVNIAPVKMHRAPVTGELGTIVGYGLTGLGNGTALTGNGVRRAGTNTIEDFVDGPNCYWTDFDDGTASNNTLPGSFLTTSSHEGQLATGDSGGGLFAVVNGETKVVGINSFNGRFDANTNSSLYGSVSGFSKISADSNWIEQQLNTMNPGRVSGRIQLGQYSLPPTNMSVTVSIHDASTDALIEGATMPLAIDGGWTISTNLRGAYRVRVKPISWLSRSSLVTITNGWTRDLDYEIATNGDCTGDNIVDIADYTLLSSKFSLSSTSVGWNVLTDFNRDNVIDIADYVILSGNFSAVGL